MALTTARISSARGRPPDLGGGIKSLIQSHSASVRSVGYGVAVIPPVYRTGATYGRLFKQPLRPARDRRGDEIGAPLAVELCQVLGGVGEHGAHIYMDTLVWEPGEDAVLAHRDGVQC